MAVRQVFHETAREVAEIDIGTDFHARRRHFLALVTALHDEWRPLLDLRLVFREQHALEQVFLLQRGIALLQKEILSSPQTKAMCGTLLMKVCGAPRCLLAT